MKQFQLLKPYLIERRFHIAAGFVSLLIVDILQLFIPRIIKWAVDGITLNAASLSELLKYSFYIVISALLIGLFRFFWRVLIMGSARRAEEGIREKLFNHIQTLPADFFDRHTAGDIMAHATNDMTNIRMALGMGIVGLTDTIVLGIAAIFFMAYINFELTCMALLPMPFIAITTKILSKKLFNAYRDVQASFSDLMEFTRERFAGIKIIKAFNRESLETHAMSLESEKYIQKNMHLIKLRGIIFPMVIFLTNVSLAIILGAGGRKVILNHISPGDFVAFISYLGLLTWPVMAVGWVTNMIQRGKASIDRIDAILDIPSETIKPEWGELIKETDTVKNIETDTVKNIKTDAVKNIKTDAVKNIKTDAVKNIKTDAVKNIKTDAVKDIKSKAVKKLQGSIEFKDVSFFYADHLSISKISSAPISKTSPVPTSKTSPVPTSKTSSVPASEASSVPISEASQVLSNIHLTLNKGTLLGIAGPPGSGKSTLTTLISRTYDPQQGIITIDGADIGRIPLEILRNNISFMPQEPFLFSGTIHTNLLFGNPDADLFDIEKALGMAQLTETMAAFPNGIETIIGEKGVMLSGGQKQRIALARAFLKDSPILILDDPVSQVDMQTADRIVKVIDSFAGRKTIIVVSHRFSIFRKADHIIVLNQGKITEQGTHKELIANKDYYSGAWKMQEIE